MSHVFNHLLVATPSSPNSCTQRRIPKAMSQTAITVQRSQSLIFSVIQGFFPSLLTAWDSSHRPKRSGIGQMQLVRDCVPTERQGEHLGAVWTGLAPLKMFIFKLVPLTLLLMPLALTWSVNGVCYQHTKIACLYRVQTCTCFTARDMSPPFLLHTSEMAGRELAQAWPPCNLCCCWHAPNHHQA